MTRRERSDALDPNNAADGNAIAPSGYTWVEQYMSSLFGDCGADAGASPSPPSVDAGMMPASEQPQAGTGAGTGAGSAATPGAAATGAPMPVAGTQAGAGTAPGASGAAGLEAVPPLEPARQENESSGCHAASGASRGTPWFAWLLGFCAIAARLRGRGFGRSEKSIDRSIPLSGDRRGRREHAGRSAHRA